MKWNYFFFLQTSYQKTPFTKYFSFNPKSPKPVLETGNRIIETGNGIVFSYLQNSDKKNSLTKYLSFNLRSPISVFETGYRIIETGNGIIFPTYKLLTKNSFYKKYSIQPKESKKNYINRK